MASIKSLPLFVCGKVVKGFGRGSKELGIPTANLSEEIIDHLPEDLKPGIYYGLSSVDQGSVYKMVLSVGWNPFYNNEKKSMEAHLLHEFENDFYGSMLKIILIDFIRPEKNFSSLDELIVAIKNDISVAKSSLDNPAHEHFLSHDFWSKGKDGVVHSKEFPASPHTSGNDSQATVNGKL